MKKVFVLVIITLALAATASAQATRTWVSGVGADDNPCSRTAPCKTFAGAISKTATGGLINVLDPGGYGTLTVGKSLTVDGEGTQASTLAALTTGFIINAGTGDTVILRNIDIHGAGSGIDGIRIMQAKKVIIENCRIHNFTNNGVKIVNSSNAIDVYIRNTEIRNVSLDGVFALPTATGTTRVFIENSTIVANGANGVHVAGASNYASLYQTSVTGNVSAGFVVEQTTSGGSAEASTFVGNSIGIQAGAGANTPTIHISHCTVTKNANGLTGAGFVIGVSNNAVVANTGSNAVDSSVLQQ